MVNMALYDHAMQKKWLHLFLCQLWLFQLKIDFVDFSKKCKIVVKNGKKWK